MSFSDKLKTRQTAKPVDTPLWKGPQEDGITFSLLCRFISCRERFKAQVVDGLRTREGFNHRLEYGNLWHVCEETYALGKDWQNALKLYAMELCKQHPLAQDQVDKWYNVCKRQFPLYLSYWSSHPDEKRITNIASEAVFSVEYPLPSGRVVRLRGKYDAVDDVIRQAAPSQSGIYLKEDKSKGDIDEVALRRQLESGFDLQTMLYLTTLIRWLPPKDRKRLRGVRYNVVRRPLSGGKGTIVQHKPSKSNPRGESSEDYYNRLAQYIEDEPGHFFMRWSSQIDDKAIQRFEHQCLIPILEQLWDWWQWLNNESSDWPYNSLHWRHPSGVFNPVDEYGHTDLDEYLATGSKIGLEKRDNLFPELGG